MKKISIIFLAILVTVVGLYFVSDIYRAELYSAAIEYEATDARLTHRIATFDSESKDASFAYYEGPKVDAQETIILLHGFGASKESWLRYAKHLTNETHVVALDLAGHGENHQNLNADYSLAGQVEFVRNATNKLGIKKFHIAGNSMGGAISVLYAATYPDQILSAILISPAGIHDVPSKMDAILAKGGNPLIVKSAEEFPALIDFVMEDGPYLPDAIIKTQGEAAAARFKINSKIFADFVGKTKGREAEEKMSKIRAPVLFIWGDKDRAINVKNIDKYASLIPNSEKLVLKNIGHLAMLEVPKISASATLEFLSKRK